MANHRNRHRRPGRRPAFRDPKPLILVVCEGKNTEPQYLEGFRNACSNPRVRIKVKGGEGVPRTIVETAKHLRDENRKQAKREGDENILFEKIWCVFDVDSHPNLDQAIDMAHANNLELAISNESFELWLILHFRENPGMQSRDKLRVILRKSMPKYDKKIDIEDYLAGYFPAVKQARRMWDDALDAGERWNRNPVTNVFELTELIRGESELNQ